MRMSETGSQHDRGAQAPPGTPETDRSRGYWRANLRLQFTLLAVWALVAYVLSIFLATVLADVSVGELPLGFWLAQQGSIFVFVALIFIYAVTMDRVDHEYGVEEQELGWARKRAEARMQRQLTGESPTEVPEEGSERP
jgi:putative solute:sodium symporter small subunit